MNGSGKPFQDITLDDLFDEGMIFQESSDYVKEKLLNRNDVKCKSIHTVSENYTGSPQAISDTFRRAVPSRALAVGGYKRQFHDWKNTNDCAKSQMYEYGIAIIELE
ncbi:hypothetical protein GOV11_00620 [Candidatus Woesearchaeota archaeon]|nr:hypothetical protein [Candidatus Woesearchaeota archaeon]